MLSRREMVTGSGLLLADGLARAAWPVLPASAVARADIGSLPRPKLGSDQVLFVDAQSSDAARYAASYNLRTTVTPKLRALCKTPDAVAAMVEWAREKQIPFALRSGGHCFEGFSQSPELVIDTRLLNAVKYDEQEKTVEAGAGALLSDIVPVLAQEGRALPTGTCLSVGIAGLSLGGGIGHLARSGGLTCDVMESVELVDAQARRLTADAASHADLFWASRGGGGGSFGAATQFRFRTVEIADVIVFETDWVLPPQEAAHLLLAWQQAGPQAPEEISSIISLTRYVRGRVLFHLAGQTTGTEAQLKSWMTSLLGEARPWSPPRLRPQPFIDASTYFSGSSSMPPGYFRFKSNIVTAPLRSDAAEALMNAIADAPTPSLTVTCEAMGGAIARVPRDATAFPHRKNALFLMQYAMQSVDETRRADDAQALSRVYQLMQPALSGASYVNYCDAELDGWARAYWQDNLERLAAIKRKYDPENVFSHGQSVPLG